MKLKVAGIACGLSASVASGAQTPNEISFNQWAKENPEPAKAILAQASISKDRAQAIIETGEITQEQMDQIRAELSPKNSLEYDIRGADQYLQADASYIHNNLGVGIQASRNDQVEQLSLTAGLRLTPSESSALSRVIDNGVIKVSLVESEVKNALANFDERGYGIEFVLNLKNAFLKQISFSHSEHGLDITDGSDLWKIAGVDTRESVSTRSTNLQTIQTTTTTSTTTETRNNATDLDQSALSVLLGLTKDLDVLLSYSRDSLGESLSSAELEYRINNAWSLRGSFEETRRFSGAQKQDVKTATLNYNKGNWSAFAGARDNGFTTSPYAGIQYTRSFGETSNAPFRVDSNNHTARSLTSPVLGVTEVHPHAIEQESRSTTTVTVEESVDNLAKGAFSDIQTTEDSISARFNVTDKDGVQGVIVQLSNGAEKRISENSGVVSFDGLTANTLYTMKLFGITNNGLNNVSEENLLGTVKPKTKAITIEETEDPTEVSDISGSTSILVGETPTYSITATDDDNGISSVTATVNGSAVTVNQTGDTYSITLPSSASANAGTVDIEFSVTGTKEDGSDDTAITKTTNVEVSSEAIEDPTIVSDISGSPEISVGDTPTYSVTATDEDDGIRSVTATVNGSAITVSQSGDSYSITLPSSATASAGTLNIEFSVTGTKEDGSDDTAITKTTSVEVKDVVVVDTQAPVITVDTTPITMTAGGVLSFPLATCTDNVDTSCNVDTDTSGVNTNTPGNYEIVYTATDTAGNTSEVRVPVTVEAAISTPMINPIGTVNIDDNGGGLPTSIPVSGSDIQPGAIFSILTPVDGLSINPTSGTMTFDKDISGYQSFSVTIKIVNPDSGEDTESFTLNVTDNF